MKQFIEIAELDLFRINQLIEIAEPDLIRMKQFIEIAEPDLIRTENGTQQLRIARNPNRSMSKPNSVQALVKGS